jgi:hypothetical protein
MPFLQGHHKDGRYPKSYDKHAYDKNGYRHDGKHLNIKRIRPSQHTLSLGASAAVAVSLTGQFIEFSSGRPDALHNPA